jgi:hypothetical protein
VGSGFGELSLQSVQHVPHPGLHGVGVGLFEHRPQHHGHSRLSRLRNLFEQRAGAGGTPAPAQGMGEGAKALPGGAGQSGAHRVDQAGVGVGEGHRARRSAGDLSVAPDAPVRSPPVGGWPSLRMGAAAARHANAGVRVNQQSDAGTAGAVPLSLLVNASVFGEDDLRALAGPRSFERSRGNLAAVTAVEVGDVGSRPRSTGRTPTRWS